jgi:hypothetical protein
MGYKHMQLIGHRLMQMSGFLGIINAVAVVNNEVEQLIPLTLLHQGRRAVH